MAKREDIVKEIVKLLKAQRTVKLGRVVRDPVLPEQLPKTAFPCLFIETTDAEFEEIAMGVSNLRECLMDVVMTIIIGGRNRDTQKNIAIEAIEATLGVDPTLGGKCKNCFLTRIESIAAQEAEPYSSCKIVFQVNYCYTL